MSIRETVKNFINEIRMQLDRVDLTPLDKKEEAKSKTSGISPREDVGERTGRWASVVVAIADAFERFIEDEVAPQLEIAEHDRCFITGIEVVCRDIQQTELAEDFKNHFSPEQIRAYIHNQIISKLPMAGAIQMTQFRGLTVARQPETSAQPSGDYSEILEMLGDASAHDGALNIRLKWRWAKSATPPSERAAAPPSDESQSTEQTPLAGLRVDIDIDDAGGKRQFRLPYVAPNRRYSIGKDSACDIVVTGTFTSRRHCEIWLDQGEWWVIDTGSRNGIRVEHGSEIIGRSGVSTGAALGLKPIKLTQGAYIVLASHDSGDAKDFPQLKLRFAANVGGASAANTEQTPTTPRTPIVQRKAAGGVTVHCKMFTGTRSIELSAEQLPFSIGRSRDQDLVIAREHESVSGRHIEIVNVDSAGAEVIVRGSNGILVDGAAFGAGIRFRWRPGQTMTLGQSSGAEPVCTLTLTATA